MRSHFWVALTCLYLAGCASGSSSLRQTVGPGPGPGCASTLDCACKNGSAAACEQLGTAPKTPKPKPTKEPPNPGPVVPPEAVESTDTEEDDERYDRCMDLYAKCMEKAKVANRRDSGGFGHSVCQQCFTLCRRRGYWPTKTAGGRKCPAVE